jgi:TRAP transporter TAXI family solute receptor
MTMAPNVMAFITPASSGIESMSDIAGKRIVVGVAGAGWEFFMRPILAAHGLTYDDFTPLYNTQAGAVDMLADGSANAAFLGGAIPTASLVQATTSQDIRFIPFLEEAKRRLVEEYPFYYPMVIPAGTYAGQDEDFPSLAFGSMHLIVNADMSEDLAYSITRAIYENREMVVARHAAGRSITADNVVRDTGTPFHPGAVRYYREIGIWPEDD